MPKLRLTKNDLKREKDALRRFERYLPMLQLKKRQLQAERQQIQRQIEDAETARRQLLGQIDTWVAVLGEGGIEPFVQVSELLLGEDNVAGVSVPVFLELVFENTPCDLFETPPWIDAAVVAIRHLLTFDLKLAVLERQRGLIDRELRTTSQRVNLFERVRIPQTKHNIGRLHIYFGDQQTAAVVRGKIAKRKRVSVGEGHR